MTMSSRCREGMEVLKHHMMEDPNVGFAVSIADIFKSVNMLARGNDPKMEFVPDPGGFLRVLLLLCMGFIPW